MTAKVTTIYSSTSWSFTFLVGTRVTGANRLTLKSALAVAAVLARCASNEGRRNEACSRYGTAMHEPEFADIYRADPTRIPKGDAHRDSTRPCAVVQAGTEVITVLGRSASGKHEPPYTLPSAAEPSCGLDKAGVIDSRHQHALWRDDFTRTPIHAFLGPLPAAPAAELQAFWDGLVYI